MPVKRPTIDDIAREAKVTKAAVSFALNGNPGVSHTTRERILAIAREVGYQPSSAARALSGGRADAFGLVIDRPARTLGIEPFFMELISGMQSELARVPISLLFTVAENQDDEIALYRAWWAQRRVDGIFLVDIRRTDHRWEVLAELGMPAVVLGNPSDTRDFAAVWNDDAAAMRTALEYLAELGHRRVARVTGLTSLRHTEIRNAAFRSTGHRLGITTMTRAADYTGEQGAAVTRELIASEDPPTAIVYDNDVMAIAGMTAAQQAGLSVPGRLSIVAWDDSPLCELVHPAVTALHRDVPAYGAHAARQLIAAAQGRPVAGEHEAPTQLTLRGSTGPAAG
jgi:DNA-binding LacI/PurR family transcriptional regulator